MYNYNQAWYANYFWSSRCCNTTDLSSCCVFHTSSTFLLLVLREAWVNPSRRLRFDAMLFEMSATKEVGFQGIKYVVTQCWCQLVQSMCTIVHENSPILHKHLPLGVYTSYQQLRIAVHVPPKLVKRDCISPLQGMWMRIISRMISEGYVVSTEKTSS